MSNSDFSLYEQIIAKSRYARWREDLKRRETWDETVQRTVDFLCSRVQISDQDRKDLHKAILNREVMPSMRVLMTAGRALERDEVAGYNCAFIAINDVRAFDEIMYVLLCGTGVGFSVERQEIQHLPCVAEEFYPTDTVISVQDSKIGWATAFRELISILYGGKIPKWDVSKVRPAGSRLKTFGGRASGPEPLVELFKFTVELFKNAAGRKLNSLECHSLICKVADIVVVGGVRRSALISLSNLSDDRMRDAKTGNWWEKNVHFALANNSSAYTEKPDIGIFMREWMSLYNSKSGERGIINRDGMVKKMKKLGRRLTDFVFGVNPCGEIVLRSCQFCNLTEVVVRPWDTKETIQEKIRLATILGTIQSTLTNFRYLRSIWKKNCEEERLLGVSLTGITDNEWLRNASESELFDLRCTAVLYNLEYAKSFGIPASTAITTVKPSGTVSQLVGCSSGIHPAYAKFYIRRIRADLKDPLAQMLMETPGIEWEYDVTKPNDIVVFSFPVKSPETAQTRHDIGAIDQLELYKRFYTGWAEHNVSITVYVKEHEWLAVGAWVYENFDLLGGVSFLPYDNGSYRQAPYEEIDEETYERMKASATTEIDWSKLSQYETDDMTVGAQEYACSGGVCEITKL